MKKFVFIFLILVFVISACASAETESEILTTSTISPTVTYTSTPNITPLPTIPTFTPTFDVSTIVMVTPAEKAECSEEQTNKIIDNLLSSTMVPIEVTIKDITNDGYNDLIVENEINKTEYGSWLEISTYVCIENEYVKFTFAGSQSPLRIPYLVSIQDLNKNSIPEIVVVEDDCWGMGRCEKPKFFEWNGTEFINLAYKRQYNDSWGDLSLSFEDIDNNGTIEILYHEGPFQSSDTRFNGPFRPYTETYSWNGKEFAPVIIEMSQPIFLFQVINDADQMTINGRYDRALLLYKDTINNKDFLPYSYELSFYYRSEFRETYDLTTIATPDYNIYKNLNEYPSLASYAYYRIMLLQLIQGQEPEADKTYQTLLDTFRNDIYAKPYIEMTTKFLKAYQVNQSMYDGCTAAIQYAVEHSEILIPLGSDYHGWQSKIYKPEDVCPFR